MTPRARRFVVAVVVLVALLIVGRWSVAFIAERWWAATISPAAAAFVSNWQLLALTLDVGAIVVASIWFAIQALLVARAIASVQVTHRLGNLHLREAVPTHLLLFGAVASGVLLGLIAGAGAHAWRDPVVLAWHGVTYGVLDPLLNLDVGVLVAQLPAWDLLHRFAVLLGVLGVAFCVALYAGIGALRRDGGAVVVHPDARRHLGVLLAFVAFTFAVGYRLEPYHLAAASPPTLTLAGALGRVRAAEVMSGVALAAGILSLIWALRGRNALLAAAWLVLVIGALGERYAVPALSEAGPMAAGRVAAARRFDALAWGIREVPAVNRTETTPAVSSLWDEEVLRRLVEHNGGVLDAVTAGEIVTPDGQATPTWLVATRSAGGSGMLDVLAIADGSTGVDGAPVMQRSPKEIPSARSVWRSVADPRSRPSSPRWRSVQTGVSASSPLRRLLLAWARQAPGMLGGKALPDVDWHLDPVERAGAVLPMLSWLPADLVLLNSRPVWLMQGMLAVDRFPLATRSSWRAGRVAGVTPAVLCTVDAASGETHFFADPAADSLAVAWLSIVGPLIASAAAIPLELRNSIPYRTEWFEAQLPALQSSGWGTGRIESRSGPPVPVWLNGRTPGHQVALEESGRNAISTVVTAFRIGGVPQIALDRRDPESGLSDSRTALGQLWNRAAVLTHLKDSVTAAGDTVWSRGPRWYAGPTPAAWQPFFTVPSNGPPALLWIATEIGGRIGGGRTSAEAWRTVTDEDRRANPDHPDDALTLESARRVLQRADSAFRRGDMTAFGRAFEELRRTLQRRRR